MSSVRSFSSFAPSVSTAAPPADEGGWTTVTSRRRGQPAPPSAAASATGWGVPTTRTKPTTVSWATTTAPPVAAAAPDTRSMKDFPSLAYPSKAGEFTRAPSTVASPPVSSWSTTVATAAAASAPQYVSRLRGIGASDTTFRTTSARLPATSSRLAAIGTRCFDDGPTDYDSPEEHDDDGAGSYHVDDEYITATETEDASGEFNPHLMSGRRAGDHSDW